MQKPMLVILAAGMGSRFGGLKQVEPVDRHKNLLIDYSIYDALRAGFSRVLCIIGKAMREDFSSLLGASGFADIQYAYQEPDKLPAGFAVPQGRVKPWGTAHALLCCKGQIDRPFAVINADDFYGRDAFETMAAFLTGPRAPGEQAMVGYAVENTLPDAGEVTRGICQVDGEGYLARIDECKAVVRKTGGAACLLDGEERFIPNGTAVSMNFWGFDPDILDIFEAGFPAFLQIGLAENPLKCEYLLPERVQANLGAGLRVKVLGSKNQWFGVTYREDMPGAQASIRALVEQGVYPEGLFRAGK